MRLVPFALALAACGGAPSDPAGDAADQDLGGAQQHVMAGVERAHQAGATAADVQRASVHFGNAYWLGRLSMLAYDEDIKGGLAAMGFPTSTLRVVANRCTGGLAYYFEAPGYAALVYRGTQGLDRGVSAVEDWLVNLASVKVPDLVGPGLVHGGFLARFSSLWVRDPACGVDEGIAALLAARKGDGELYLTGHSQGAALATLTLAATQGSVCAARCTLYTFGSPKVGDEAFAFAVAERARGKTPIFRFVNGDDIVTGIPRNLDPLEPVHFRHLGYAGEPEEVFQVWVKDRELSVSSFVLHLTDDVGDHLGYLPPLEFQAKAWHQLH